MSEGPKQPPGWNFDTRDTAGELTREASRSAAGAAIILSLGYLATIVYLWLETGVTLAQVLAEPVLAVFAALGVIGALLAWRAYSAPSTALIAVLLLWTAIELAIHGARLAGFDLGAMRSMGGVAFKGVAFGLAVHAWMKLAAAKRRSLSGAHHGLT